MNGDGERRIVALAASQHGVVTRAQLVALGLSSSAIGRRMRSGRLGVLHRGVYLVGPVAPPGAAEMAAVLATGEGAVVSHRSALHLWSGSPSPLPAGAPCTMHGAPPGGPAPPVDVTVAANRGRRPGIRVHRVPGLDPDERTLVEGIPVTTPARTLLDMAAVVGARELEHIVARAEREGQVTRDDLAALLARHPRKHGAGALRSVLEATGGPALTRSEAEARTLALLREAGLPPPETNVRVGPYELDVFWRTAGIAVEVDGFAHHATRPRFEGDRRRDAWLAASGITVIRLSWRQITERRTATAVQVGQALAQAMARRR